MSCPNCDRLKAELQAEIENGHAYIRRIAELESALKAERANREAAEAELRVWRAASPPEAA